MIRRRCKMTFWAMWSHWHLHHEMAVASSMLLLNLFSQENQNKVQHNFGVILCHWCWCKSCMVTTVSSMAHSICKVRMIKRRCNVTFLVVWYQWYHQGHHCICLVKIIKMRHITGTVVGITWCQWYQNMAPMHSYDQHNWNGVKHVFLVNSYH